MKISVQKYNPSVDAEPYFGTYEIEHTEHMTLLEALVVINPDNPTGHYLCRTQREPRARVRPLRHDAQRHTVSRLRYPG